MGTESEPLVGTVLASYLPYRLVRVDLADARRISRFETAKPCDPRITIKAILGAVGTYPRRASLAGASYISGCGVFHDATYS